MQIIVSYKTRDTSRPFYPPLDVEKSKKFTSKLSGTTEVERTCGAVADKKWHCENIDDMGTYCPLTCGELIIGTSEGECVRSANGMTSSLVPGESWLPKYMCAPSKPTCNGYARGTFGTCTA